MEKKAIYVFLRKDLTQTQRIVQTGHICLEVGRKSELPDERYNIIVLGIRSENKLKEVMKELEELGIRYLTFCEPDMKMEMTAVATVPLVKERGDALSRYRLIEEMK